MEALERLPEHSEVLVYGRDALKLGLVVVLVSHMFGLSCAKKYGGIYVPPHQAVIHQFAREMLAGGGKMILGSDSHTRYGALGTMAMGEGGPELVKQLLNKTYDINMPKVVGVHMTGKPAKGVGFHLSGFLPGLTQISTFGPERA